jgi:hypothetical protein
MVLRSRQQQEAETEWMLRKKEFGVTVGATIVQMMKMMTLATDCQLAAS